MEKQNGYSDDDVRDIMAKEIRNGEPEPMQPKQNKFRDGVNRTFRGVANVAKSIGKEIMENKPNGKKKKQNYGNQFLYNKPVSEGGMFRNPDVASKKKNSGGMFNNSMLKEKAQNNIFNSSALNEYGKAHKKQKQKGFRFMY
jgi:sialic acid synthase SpsE